jgi:hypothetical protein
MVMQVTDILALSDRRNARECIFSLFSISIETSTLINGHIINVSLHAEDMNHHSTNIHESRGCGCVYGKAGEPDAEGGAVSDGAGGRRHEDALLGG